jgi:hypothetical protein
LPFAYRLTIQINYITASPRPSLSASSTESPRPSALLSASVRSPTRYFSGRVSSALLRARRPPRSSPVPISTSQLCVFNVQATRALLILNPSSSAASPLPTHRRSKIRTPVAVASPSTSLLAYRSATSLSESAVRLRRFGPMRFRGCF